VKICHQKITNHWVRSFAVAFFLEVGGKTKHFLLRAVLGIPTSGTYFE
jgi:hypothetical protein